MFGLTSRRWSILLSLALGAVAGAGCDRCTSEAPPAPPPPKELGDLEMVTPPAEDAARKRWDELAAELEVEDASPGELAYAVPPCPLRYEIRAEHFTEVAEGREPAGVVTVAEVLVTPEPDHEPPRVGLTLEKVQSALSIDGERGTKPVELDGWPPTRLKVERRAWRETEGPSTLWAAHTVFPALAALFFPLPEGPEPGASAGWKQRIFDRAETAKAEKLRDAGKPPHPKAPEEQLAHLTIVRWVTIGGTKAAVLDGEWSWSDRQIEPIESRRAERWVARGVFLASGWPLYFASFANLWRFSAPTADQGHHALGTQLRVLRLVEACEGPTLPRFPAP